MKTKLIATLMLAGSSLFAGPRVFMGLNVGVPVAPLAVGYAAPCPGPGYAWVDGGYTFVGGRRVFNRGYWRAPVVVGRFDNRAVHSVVARRGVERGFRR
jgi:hypothetical protein